MVLQNSIHLEESCYYANPEMSILVITDTRTSKQTSDNWIWKWLI